MKVWEKVYHINSNQNGVGVVILIKNKTEFESKFVTRNKEGHFTVIKGKISQIDIISIKYTNITTKTQNR